jgi:hypothetical protein
MVQNAVNSSARLRTKKALIGAVIALVSATTVVGAAAQTGRMKLSKRKGTFYLVGCATAGRSMKASWSPGNPNRINGIGTIYNGPVHPTLANALSEDCTAARNYFGVRAPMLLVDEDGPENAVATNIVLSPDGPDGTVFFGNKLGASEMRQSAGYGIPTVIGHEYAHIMQMKNRLLVRNVKWRELHADFMAGWFTALRAHFRPQDLNASAYSIFSKGDYAFNEPGHHGTPAERTEAFVAGATVLLNRQATSGPAAYTAGINYIWSKGASLDPSLASDSGHEESKPSESEGEEETVPYFMRK